MAVASESLSDASLGGQPVSQAGSATPVLPCAGAAFAWERVLGSVALPLARRASETKVCTAQNVAGLVQRQQQCVCTQMCIYRAQTNMKDQVTALLGAHFESDSSRAPAKRRNWRNEAATGSSRCFAKLQRRRNVRSILCSIRTDSRWVRRGLHCHWHAWHCHARRPRRHAARERLQEEHRRARRCDRFKQPLLNILQDLSCFVQLSLI